MSVCLSVSFSLSLSSPTLFTSILSHLCNNEILGFSNDSDDSGDSTGFSDEGLLFQ